LAISLRELLAPGYFLATLLSRDPLNVLSPRRHNPVAGNTSVLPLAGK
jgi:hypothetical protein